MCGIRLTRSDGARMDINHVTGSPETYTDSPVVTFPNEDMKIAVDGQLVPVLSHLSSSSIVQGPPRLLVQSDDVKFAVHDD